jgi:hypothetical protein
VEREIGGNATRASLGDFDRPYYAGLDIRIKIELADLRFSSEIKATRVKYVMVFLQVRGAKEAFDWGRSPKAAIFCEELSARFGSIPARMHLRDSHLLCTRR